MFRDSSKALLAGLMWAIITVRLFPPRESWMGRGRAGGSQQGAASLGPAPAHDALLCVSLSHSRVLVLSTPWALPRPLPSPHFFPLPVSSPKLLFENFQHLSQGLPALLLPCSYT